MYTDGGSIPRIAQAFNGFSPWGYAPAYMIHDWLLSDVIVWLMANQARGSTRYAMSTSTNSATILAESIQALVASNQVKPMTWPVRRSAPRSIASSPEISGTRPAHAPRRLSVPRTGLRRKPRYQVQRQPCAAGISTLRRLNCLLRHRTPLQSRQRKSSLM